MTLMRSIDLKLIIYFNLYAKGAKPLLATLAAWALKLALLFSLSLEAGEIRIFAASDLKFALDDVKSTFLLKHPRDGVEIVYGSSGKGVVQITNGAPFDLFFSANMELVRKMHASGDIVTKPLAYAKGRVVVWSRQKEFDPKLGVSNLNAAWVKKVAIANPVHAPYGQKAIEVLKSLGVYDSLSLKLVMGENISQAASFIASKNADIGIIALSLALSPTISKSEQPNFVLLDERLHTPLIQGYGITTHGSKSALAREFYEFMQSAKADEIMKKYGFGLL